MTVSLDANDSLTPPLDSSQCYNCELAGVCVASCQCFWFVQSGRVSGSEAAIGHMRRCIQAR